MNNHIVKYKKNDLYYTPEWTIESIIEYIPKDFKVWECCCGKKNISNVLEKNGYKVISTDIEIDEKYDFLKYEPEEEYDIIITNPPFSIKNKIIEKCYKLKKPFILLMTTSGIESQKRIKMYKKNGISFLLPSRRINYYSNYKKKKTSSPFYSWWFCYKIPNIKENTFIYLNDEKFYNDWKKKNNKKN